MFIVYKAVNKETNKVYVGQTGRTLEERIYFHHRFANSDRPTKSCRFATALRKYSQEFWEWSVLGSYETREEAKAMEVFFIKELGAFESGYNSTEGADGSHGRILSEDTRGKISKSHLGKSLSEEHKAMLSQKLKGRKLSDEDKANKAEAARKREYKSKSGVKGVHLSSSGRWIARFVKSRREVFHLGTFDTIEQASSAIEKIKERVKP